MNLALRELTPDDVLAPLFDYHINPKLEERFTKAEEELRNLLNDRKGHAITYNHYYTENVQRLRSSRMNRRYEKVLNSLEAQSSTAGKLDKNAVLAALTGANQTEADMEEFACEEVLDCMLAFYKVRLDIVGRGRFY